MLFCFPVFSTEASKVISLSKREFFLSCNEMKISNYSGSRSKHKVNQLKWKILKKEKIGVEKTLLNKNSNTHLVSSPVYFYKLFSDLTSHLKKILYPAFVNISFLKELKTVKMLC